MRVTDSLRYEQVNRQLASAKSRFTEASERALTGRRINAPSDDPFAASELVQINARNARVESQKSNITQVRGDAEMAEGVLAEAGDLLARIHEIAVQGGSDSTSAEGRSTLAAEVTGLKSALLSLANTKGSNGYLFAGSQITTQPFDSSGAFQADDAAHSVDIGTGVPTRVNASGAKAFTAAGGRDIFADLDTLVTALSSNDGAGVRATLDNIKANGEQIQNERGQRGLLMGRLDTSEATLDRAGLLLAKQDDDMGGIDPAQAYSEFVSLSQALDRAIGVSRELLNLSNLGTQG
jgi:flagellar hook-associated protein 3 FlgL